MKKLIFLISLVLTFLTLSFYSYAYEVLEQEPNNEILKAQLIPLNKKVLGIMHHEDGLDHYKVLLPSTGKVRVKFYDVPSTCVMLVQIVGFGASQKNFDNRVDKTIDYTFNASSKEGYIIISFPVKVAELHIPKQWSARKCYEKGDYRLTPFGDGSTKNVPFTYQGHSIGLPVSYGFSVTLEGSSSSQTQQVQPVFLPKELNPNKPGRYIFEDEELFKVKPELNRNFPLNETIVGYMHYGDYTDNFQFKLPSKGTVKVRFSTNAYDCDFFITAIDFQNKPGLTKRQIKVKGSQISEMTFTAEGTIGVINVTRDLMTSKQMCNDKVCVTQCSPNGPIYYASSPKDRGIMPFPPEGTTFDNKPVMSMITYYLSVSMIEEKRAELNVVPDGVSFLKGDYNSNELKLQDFWEDKSSGLFKGCGKMERLSLIWENQRKEKEK
ncbi:hypothetical protein [Thermodesulfovibrio yellowstonii]|jgi:hypothetical protein|uniref:hypothetical protein n=1 Tax=Thermodesulfovibrio yellowstonii TaxID=28262 RepID=UPI003F857885